MPSWSSTPTPDLPDGLVLFDGVCALCSRLVRFLTARDPAGHFRYVPIQSELGRRLAERFGIDPEAPQTNVVIADGMAHFKSDAGIAALSSLPGRRYVRAARLLPKPLRDVLYDRVAKNRYAWFGRHESCMMPTPGMTERFLATEADLARVMAR